MAIAERQPARVSRLLVASASATLVGIALAAAGEPGIGGFMTLGALVALIFSVHKLGRLGPDPPAVFEQFAPRPTDALRLDPEVINRHRDAWVDDWRSIAE